ncbi:Periplasmic serine endoprotease DegP [Gammaproteobacteria bacterium]
MKYLKHVSYGVLALFLTITCYAGRPITGIAETSPSLAPMLQKIMPTIVNVSVRGEVPADSLSPQDKRRRHNGSKNNSRFEDLGSGVIIDAQHGYIVTNAHVIKDAQSITVTLSDDRSMRAKVIGYDPPSDIAVIQIAAKRLKNATYGDSDKLKVGDFVCAIGSPFGLQKTVTSGVVSGLERNDLGIEGFESFIQTDASINPGSSGGALVNMQGELVGINTALIGPIPSSAGIGLAIPSNMTKNIVEQIIKYGKVKRGVMGVIVQNITPALAEAMHLKEAEGGALISQVMEGSPAATAGLHPKDVIIKIMDKPVHSAAQVRNVASLSSIGSKVILQVRRDNKLINLEPVIADPEDLKKTQEVPKNLLSGLGLKNFNLLIDNQQIKGVEVLYVDDASVAYSCGLSPTDVILTAANQPVTTISQLQAIANKNPKQLLLEIKRGLSGNFFLVLEE